MFISKLLLFVVFMRTTSSSPSESISNSVKRFYQCADIEVHPSERRKVVTFSEEAGAIWFYPSADFKHFDVTLTLELESSRITYQLVLLSDLCITDLSKWYKIHVNAQKINGYWGFRISSGNCNKDFATHYWYCCNHFKQTGIVAEGGSWWNYREPKIFCGTFGLLVVLLPVGSAIILVFVIIGIVLMKRRKVTQPTSQEDQPIERTTEGEDVAAAAGEGGLSAVGINGAFAAEGKVGSSAKEENWASGDNHHRYPIAFPMTKAEDWIYDDTCQQEDDEIYEDVC